MIKNNILIISIVALLVILTGCTSIEKSKAEEIAIDFVKKNVKFYSKVESEDNMTSVPEFDFDAVSSYQNGRNWVVAINVKSEVEGEVKQNDLLITVRSDGELLSFNGREIPDNYR